MNQRRKNNGGSYSQGSEAFAANSSASSAACVRDSKLQKPHTKSSLRNLNPGTVPDFREVLLIWFCLLVSHVLALQSVVVSCALETPFQWPNSLGDWSQGNIDCNGCISYPLHRIIGRNLKSIVFHHAPCACSNVMVKDAGPRPTRWHGTTPVQRHAFWIWGERNANWHRQCC